MNMKQTHWYLTLMISLFILACALVSRPATSAVASGGQVSDPGRVVYDNTDLWNQLSGAKQSVLQAIYGQRPPSKNVPRKPGGGKNTKSQADGAGGNEISDSGAVGEESSGQIEFLDPTVVEPIDLPVSRSRARASRIAPQTLIASPFVNNPLEDTTSEDTQSETAIVLGAGSNVVCAFNDSGSFAQSFGKFTGYSQSTNGGANWTDKATLPTSTGGDAGDPCLARSSATGTILFSTLEFAAPSTRLQIFRSTDNGGSFQAAINGAPGFNTTTGDHDKDWITADNFPGPGNGNFYLGWRNFGTPGGMTLTRSTDDGLTWGPSGGLTIASGGQGAFVTVGPDHSLYYFWYDSSAFPRKISLRKSTDQGLTFGSTINVANLIGTGVNGDLSLNGGFRSNSFAQAAVNAVNGDIYVAYNDTTGGVDRGNIFLKRSTDGGATWGAAAMVNNDGTTRDQFMPSLAVRPDGTGLAVSWYDRRRDPNDFLIERWAAIATVSGSAAPVFGPNFRIGSPFRVAVGQDPVIVSTYMGDYDMAAADNSFYYFPWGDNGLGTSFHPLGQPDVRFAKVAAGGSGPLLDQPIIGGSATVSGGNGNGKIDPNECNDLSIVVKNDGGTLASNINAVLSTSTPGVTVSQANSTYPDLAPGASAANNTAFKVSTSPSFVCGTSVTFTLALTYTQGSDTISLSAPSTQPNGSYQITTSTGVAIVPGTTDTGNHCDDCTTLITLPFMYTLYAQPFTTARVMSNGVLEFISSSTAFSNSCLPSSQFNYAIFPHWDDLCTDVGCDAGGPGTNGVFTSISGIAPNRIFNIEWRARYFSGGGSANFEVRLYENQTRFDIIYGNISQGGAGATVGVQQGTGSAFTQFECNTANSLLSGLMVSFALPPAQCPDGGGQCGFDTCVKDDGGGGFIRWNSQTGDYIFTKCGPSGFTVSGTGTVRFVNSVQWLSDIKPDRRISADFLTGQLTGGATLVLTVAPGVSQTIRINQTTPHPTCACP